MCADFTLHNPIAASEAMVALQQADAHQQLYQDVKFKTFGTDKGYHQKSFVQDCRERGIAPHVARKDKVQVARLDGRTTTRRSYQVSLKIRKRVEEIFGWIKTVGGLRRSQYRGLERTQAWGYFVVGTYNPLRLARRRRVPAWRAEKELTSRCFMVKNLPMKIIHVAIGEARSDLCALVKRVSQGERVVLTNHGRPAALLVPFTAPEIPWRTDTPDDPKRYGDLQAPVWEDWT